MSSFPLGTLLCNALPGSGRDLCERQSDARTRLGADWHALGNERTVWGVGYADLHRGPEHTRHGCTLGDQRRNASRDIFFENALPVIDGPAFAAYVEKVLVPELTPGTVVILDNLATHKNAQAAAALRNAGCWFLFLPPYSPDLNPIEMAFSKLKAHLRWIGARTFTDMFNAIAEICDLYSIPKSQPVVAVIIKRATRRQPPFCARSAPRFRA